MQMNGMAISRPRLAARLSCGLVALAVFAGAAAPARASTARAFAVRDTIRGIVFDSLLHQPIPDATVQSDAGGVATTTDKEGRFTLIAAETIHHVTVFHDFLDRSGLGSLQAEVTEKTSHSMMVMSTPSLATIWARVCGAMPLDRGRGGIVFGSVRAADGKTRLAGAQVRVSWDFEARTVQGVKPVRTSDTKTDGTGSYYACGTPPYSNVYVTGYSNTLRSGAITVPGDTLPLRRVDIVLGEDGKTATIHGVVRDPRKAPLSGATVDVDGVADAVRTDANGKFTVPNVPTGSRTIGIRSLSYAPLLQPITVLEGQNEDIQVDMLATSLSAVNINARQNLSLEAIDFEQRRREGFGTFIDSTTIQRNTSMRSNFQGIPSLVITGVDSKSFSLFTPVQSIQANGNNPAGGCPANIYIDGKPSDTDVLITLAKEQIAAIEVYIRQEFAPAKYLLLGNNCGVVLVWTKMQFSQLKKNK